MITQCPYCKTVFRVSEAHLNVAESHVRCGHCRRVFNAANHLLDTGEEEKENRGRAKVPEEYLELLEMDAHGAPGRSRLGLLFWTLLSLILAGGLAGQYVWGYRPELILQNAHLRPWLEHGCKLAGCQLPPTRALDRIQVSKRHVEPHPDATAATLIHLEFRNSATFAQPYPRLEVRFRDENGRTIAARRFSPEEYLKEAQSAAGLMAVDEAVHVKLEVRDVVEKMSTYGFKINFL